MESSKNIKELISYSEKGITSKVISKEGKMNVTLFCMAADTNMGKHTTTKQAIVYVIEGKGIFNLEGEDIEMVPGKIIFLEENALHSLSAKENTSFLLVLT